MATRRGKFYVIFMSWIKRQKWSFVWAACSFQPLQATQMKTDGENPKPSHLQNSSFVTFSAKFEELCGY